MTDIMIKCETQFNSEGSHLHNLPSLVCITMWERLKKCNSAEYVLLLLFAPPALLLPLLPCPVDVGPCRCSCHNTLALPFSDIIMDWIFASLLSSKDTWPDTTSPPENVTFGFKALKFIVKFLKVSSNILSRDWTPFNEFLNMYWILIRFFKTNVTWSSWHLKQTLIWKEQKLSDVVNMVFSAMRLRIYLWNAAPTTPIGYGSSHRHNIHVYYVYGSSQ